jgi:hypothetical protein
MPNNAVYYDATLPDEALPIVWGRDTSDPDVPEGGCMGEARRTLVTETPEPTTDVVRNLIREAAKRSTEHGQVREATDKWLACVKQAGWPYESPHDAVRHWNSLGADGEPTPEEVDAAVADVKCKQETNLHRLWAAAEVAYQRKLFDENTAQIQHQRAWLDEMLRNAIAVVKSGG